MANVEKFKYWCNKILPLVYDDSLSYMEFLGKVYEKLNETIDAVNANTDAITEFDQRINDFIAAETEARESWEDQQERDRQSWEDQQAQKWSAFQAMFIAEYDPDNAYVKGDLCSVQYKMYVANASTTGTFDPTKWDEIVLSDYLADYVSTATAAMQSQYDVFLEEYQREFGISQILGGSTTEAVSQDLISSALFIPAEITWTDGKYINTMGNLTDNDQFAATDYIEISGPVLIFASLAEAASIAIYGAAHNFITSIQNNGSLKYYIGKNINYKYVRFCTRKSSLSTTKAGLYAFKSFVDVTNYIYNYNVMPNPTYEIINGTELTWTEGEYVNSTNGNFTALSGFSRTDKIESFGIEFIKAFTAEVAGIALYDADGNFLTGIAPTTISGSHYHYYYIPYDPRCKYIAFCQWTQYSPVERVEVVKTTSRKSLDTAKILKRPVLSLYDKIVCCGDSLTYSQVYTSTTTSRQAKTTYPETITKLTGTETVNLASPGYTSSDWWTAYQNSFVANALYIIYLGTNGGLTNTVDTDCPGTDPTEYANNFTGNYGRIIATALSNGGSVILVRVRITNGDLTETNAAIAAFGAKFNIPVITSVFANVTNQIYHKWPNGSGTNYTHFNDLGYVVFAEWIKDQIETLPDASIAKILPKN